MVSEAAEVVRSVAASLPNAAADFPEAALAEHGDEISVSQRAVDGTLDNPGEDDIIKSELLNTRINSRGSVLNPMNKADYDRISKRLQSSGVETVPVTDGDDLRYMQMIGAEATYSQGRISHIGEVPSRGTFLEEIIHYSQEQEYGEMALGDYEELYAREIEANRKLLKYRKEYKLDEMDVEDIKRNLERWESRFIRTTGVSYDDSHYRG